jgi:hypothetical protein
MALYTCRSFAARVGMNKLGRSRRRQQGRDNTWGYGRNTQQPASGQTQTCLRADLLACRSTLAGVNGQRRGSLEFR